MNLTDDEPTFTIALVDDNPRAMRSQMNRIKNYVEKKDLKLKLLVDETGKKFVEFLEKEIIDLFLVDQNISQQLKGLDIVKAIRQANDITDILFYSAIEGEEENLAKAGGYTFTEVVKGREIARRIEQLIDKNLMKWEDVSLLRGIVISKVIDLELDVNSFFESYFKIPEARICDFRNFVLENSYNSFEGKKQTLTRIVKNEGLKNATKTLRNHMGDLQKERNLLAHCKKHPEKENCLLSMGYEEVFDKKRIDGILAKTREAKNELNKLAKKLNVTINN